MLGYLRFHKGQQRLHVLLGIRGNFLFQDTAVVLRFIGYLKTIDSVRQC